MQRISIIIPVYNERKTLLEIVRRVKEASVLGLEKEIILIDDGSRDGTQDILKTLENQYKVVYHSKNQGKGAALRTGFKEAGGDIILIQDADLEYDPREYPKLIQPILDGKSDVVYGSRYMTKKPRLWSKYYLGGIITNFFLNVVCFTRLTDFWTCYKAFKSPVIKSLELESNRFDIEVEMTIKLLRRGYKILEVPINYAPRGSEEGKKIKPKDGLISIWKILKYRLGR